MALLLSIETSTPVCSVALHQDAEVIAFQSYHQEKSAAALLPMAIKQMMENSQIDLQSLDGIAVSSGPGSYTGLRIGASTAKGMAYGLGKPLLSVSALDAMIVSVRQFPVGDEYLCPMIDARRMEVYCQLEQSDRKIWEVQPLVVEADSFADFTDRPLYLFGDGSAKTKAVLFQENIHWIPNVFPSAQAVGILAEAKFNSGVFEDVAYFEPTYLKEFQAKPAKKLL
jgi:tRNA threonylcarbamoyladenosine biosynthesis protein TsaB